jgi:hypothetical protein
MAEVVESEIDSQVLPTTAENLQFDTLGRGKDMTQLKLMGGHKFLSV